MSEVRINPDNKRPDTTKEQEKSSAPEATRALQAEAHTLRAPGNLLVTVAGSSVLNGITELQMKTSPEGPSPKAAMPEMIPPIDKAVAKESAARLQHIGARTALENARQALKEYQQVPQQLKTELADYAQRMKAGGYVAPAQNIARQIQFIETMEKRTAQGNIELLKSMTGTAEQVARGQKVFVENAPRTLQLEKYNQAALESQKACTLYSQSLENVRRLQESRLSLPQLKTPSTSLAAEGALKAPSAERGFLRGAGSMAILAGGLYAADATAREISGEKLSLSEYKISPLMEPNMVDAMGAGMAANRMLPMKYRVLSLGATAVAGRAWNAGTELLLKR